MELSVWENVFLGVMALGLIFWMGPGIKSSMEQSKNVSSDWLGAAIPLIAVVVFVVFLITMV